MENATAESLESVRWLTTSEAAQYLRVSISSIKTMIYRGQVRVHKLGRRNRFLREELERSGTSIAIEIPTSEAPRWFANKIEIPEGSTVVITDDDLTIHEIWDRKLGDRKGITRVHLHTPSELLEWYRQNIMVDPVVYLCDYEFAGTKQTGIELIEMAGIAAQSLLVTSHWDEEEVRARSLKSGIRIPPKALAGFVALF